ncbi:unnamed protein product [Prorocentrum cordatum]|uniref:Uncharacterized protein n=1 Tax=Prorocentrum cordatum TaxID=2364126 RepID=A0ABN9SG40_9DINO|nr:unnamed protein product [Polarella glacialis]
MVADIDIDLDDIPTFPPSQMGVQSGINKRRAGHQPAGDADFEIVHAANLQDSIEALRAELLEQVTNTTSALNSSLQGLATRVQSTCSAMASQVEQRLNGVEVVQRGHTKQLQVLHEEVKLLKRELSVVKETPSELPTTFPKLSLDSAFNRAIDVSIIVVRCKEQTARQQVHGALLPWLERLNIESSEWELQGEPSDKRFTIKFKGSSQFASRRVQHALSLLRPQRPGEEWMRFFAPAISGSRSEIFVGSDKKQCQVKREVALKAAKRTKFFVDKLRGTISTNWRQLVEITPQADDAPRIRWAEANLALENISREAIEEPLAVAIQGDSQTQWSL